jgi:hypothetical protein
MLIDAMWQTSKLLLRLLRHFSEHQRITSSATERGLWYLVVDVDHRSHLSHLSPQSVGGCGWMVDPLVLGFGDRNLFNKG